ncbi:MAG: hypothetical protein PHS66_07150 [Candidatus Omnitrophica bacterium]|nr:hypothetical protein [Candidatus Omnitrophota bacterium]
MKKTICLFCLALFLTINTTSAYSAKVVSRKQPPSQIQPQENPPRKDPPADIIEIPEGKILVDRKDFEDLKKDVNVAIKNSVKYSREEIVLDDKFVNKIQNHYRQKIDKIRSELGFYSGDLLNYVSGLIKNPNSYLFSELSSLDGASYQCITGIWAMTYAYDLTSLFVLSSSQYSIYPQLKVRLEYSLKVLNESIGNLSKSLAQSKNTAFRKVLLNVVNKTKEAKDLIEKLKAEIDSRYEAAKKSRALKK